MARIDFYVLQRADERARHTLACKLAEKAYRLENTVHIQVGNRRDAEMLDEMLWTFRDGSFVPHALSGVDDETAGSPVIIGCDNEGVTERDLLINLCNEIPACAEMFPRIAELVSADENCRQLSRKRFATYRDNGHSIQTHKL